MFRLDLVLKNLVNLIIGVVVLILGLRILFRLFAANGDNSFVQWIYDSSGEIMGPFRGIFPSTNIEGSIIDFSALFAIFVYILIGFFVVYLIDLMTPDTVVEEVDDRPVTRRRRLRR